MPQGCCVPMCTKAGGHRFPKDPNRKKIWLKAICRDSLVSPDLSRVCRDHFLPKDYKDDTSDAPTPFLKKDAVPSKFPWTGNRLFEEKKDAWRKVKVLGKKRGRSLKCKNMGLEKKGKLEENLVNNGSSKTENLNQLQSTTDQSLKVTIDEIKKVDHSEDSNEIRECRVCLQKLKVNLMYGLFQCWNPTLQGPGKTIAEDLTSLSNIQLSENDIHSQYICHACCMNLSNACHFKMMVEDNDRILRQRIQKDCEKVLPKLIQEDLNINGANENSLPFNVDIKQEVLTDDEACNIEDGYMDANFMCTKVEPEELVDQPPMVFGKMEENILNNESSKTNNLNQSKNTTDQSLEITIDGIQKVDLSQNGKELRECRACLQQRVTYGMYGLFQSWNSTLKGPGNTIAEDLTSLSNIQLSENEIHSKYICHTCCLKLSSACHFKMMVEENDRILRLKILEDYEKVWPQPIQVEKTINGAYENQPFNVDIKQEVLTDDESCDMDEGYTDANFMDIQLEPEEFVDQPPIVVGVTSLKEFPTGEIAMQLLNGETKTDNEFLLQAVKEEPVSDSEETDMSLECLLCTRPFHSVTGLKAHVIAQHSYQTVGRDVGDRTNDKHVCATCRRTFTTSTDLMVHETCHNKHVCYGCSAKYETFASLSSHRKRCKALANTELKKPKTLDDVLRTQVVEDDQKPREINDVTTVKKEYKMFSCPKCNEIFTDSYYVKIHQDTHHSKEIATKEEVKSPPLEIEMLESIFNEET